MEKLTVVLLEAALKVDTSLLTTPNRRKRTPSDLAMLCKSSSLVERRFTVIVLCDYQIPAPDKPMYKRPPYAVCMPLADRNLLEITSRSGSPRSPWR